MVDLYVRVCRERRRAAALSATAVLICLMPGVRAAAGAALTEREAVRLLDGTLKRKCAAYQTEEATKAYFEIAVREVHSAECGGDPEVEPVMDRFRVFRKTRELRMWDPVTDEYKPYQPAQTK
jgi:hypothetical protein